MTEWLKIERGSGNVFRDLGFPEPEAPNLLLRADLMIAIQRYLHRLRRCGSSGSRSRA
jgi:predicted XRE-type DNA-binding protein